MKLTVYERLILLNILTGEGDLTTLRIVRKLREALSFTEEEHATLNIRMGEDWAKCPRCKGEAVEFPSNKADPARRCIACNYEGVQGLGQIFWNTAAPQEAEIEIGNRATKVVCDKLEELSQAKKLLDVHLSLCDKFDMK